MYWYCYECHCKLESFVGLLYCELIAIVYTARRYASAALADLCLCLSVSVSVTSRSSIETDERIELFFLAWELHATNPILCCKEIRISS